MLRKIIALLAVCLLLACSASAEQTGDLAFRITTTDGSVHSFGIVLPDGSECIETGNSLMFRWKDPAVDAGAFTSLYLTISCERLPFESNTPDFLDKYMVSFKTGFTEGLSDAQFIGDDTVLTIGSMDFIRSICVDQEKTYCTYICLADEPDTDISTADETGSSLIYRFTTDADPESIEPVLASFTVK